MNSNYWNCESKKTHQNVLSHQKNHFFAFFVIIDINTAANLKQGTHDVSAIYMQNMNATFYKIVQRHYSGEVGSV